MSPISIVVPVHGAAELTRSALESIAATTPPDVRVAIIDDASRDADIDTLLAPDSLATIFGARPVEILRNEVNAGFPTSVNRALRAVAPDDAIVINSDVRVAGDWLARLMDAASRCERLGTLSCFANSGTMLSLPYRNRPSAGFPDGMPVEDAAQRLPRGTAPVEIPNPVGHVMLVSRRAIDAVGELDEAFNPGYGEEVDFGLRAAEAGFRHWLATDVVVFHRAGASFGSEARNRLARRHAAIVEARYPYVWDVVEHFESSPTAGLGAAVEAASLPLRRPSVRLLDPAAQHDSAISTALGRRFEIHREDGAQPDVDVVLVGQTVPRLRADVPAARLVVLLERIDLATGPWLHPGHAGWANWVSAVADLCAAADVVLAPDPERLAQWGIRGPIREIPGLEGLLRPAPERLEQQPDVVEGPVGSAAFLAAAREHLGTSPGRVAQLVPALAAAAVGEASARDGSAKALGDRYAGRLTPPALFARVGPPRDALLLHRWAPWGDASFVALELVADDVRAARADVLQALDVAVGDALDAPPSASAIFRSELYEVDDARESNPFGPAGRWRQRRRPMLSKRIRDEHPLIGRLIGSEDSRRFILARSAYQRLRGF